MEHAFLLETSLSFYDKALFWFSLLPSLMLPLSGFKLSFDLAFLFMPLFWEVIFCLLFNYNLHVVTSRSEPQISYWIIPPGYPFCTSSFSWTVFFWDPVVRLVQLVFSLLGRYVHRV